MIFRVLTVFCFLTLILPFVTASHWSRRHQEIAHRALFPNARFTFYDVGLGACGQYNVASDWIVALNVEQYGSGYPGPMCFQSITIQYGGKTAQATIMDECMGCPWGGLDFSRGLFDYFASESEGVLYGTWWFNSGGGGDQTTTTSTWTPPTTTWEPPATTSTPDYTPTPTSSSTPDYTPPTTSSTPAYTPTTTMTSTTSSTSFTSSATSLTNSSTSLTSGLTVPTGEAVPPSTNSPQNTLAINNISIQIGGLLAVCGKK